MTESTPHPIRRTFPPLRRMNFGGMHFIYGSTTYCTIHCEFITYCVVLILLHLYQHVTLSFIFIPFFYLLFMKLLGWRHAIHLSISL